MDKLINNLQFRVYTDILKKSKKDGKRLIRGYASTAALDRQNEVITIEALRQAADHLLENHTVFYEHEHQKFPVGKVIETGIDDKGLKVIVEISQTADQLWTLIEEDILDSFSIGGRVTASEEKVGKDGKPYNEVTGIELFEVSVVGLPANPEAKFALVNKSFNMAITDEIKKREEDREMEEKKKIETISSDATNTKVATATTDADKVTTSDTTKIVKPKVEEQKVEKVVEEKAERKEETTKVEKKEASKVVEEKEDAQKKDLEKYKKEDKEAAEKIEKEKVEEPKETIEDKEKVEIKKEEVKEEKSEPSKEKKEGPKIEEKETDEASDESDAVWDYLIDEVENAKQYPYPYRYPYYPYPYYGYPYTYPYPAFLEQTGEVMFLLDKLIAGEKDEKRKASLQEIKAKISKLQGGKYPYPEEYPYPKAKSDGAEKEVRYPYPYPRLSEEVKEIIFLLDKLIETETNEDVKAMLQEIKAKVSKLVGQVYPYPEKYPYPKKGDETGKQYPAPEAALKEILAGLKDLGKKIDEVLSRLPEKDVEVKEPEEKKEEPKVEKKVEKPEKKVEEKPQRKSFIADAPYAPEEKKKEKDKDKKTTTEKGWSRIIYGNR